MIILGIDPGARHAGLALRDTTQPDNAPAALLYHEHVERRPDDDARLWALRVARRARMCAGQRGVHRIAVEGVNAPTGHLGTIDPTPLLDTAYVVGALIAELSAAVIAPSGFGSPVAPGTPAAVARRILEALYPPELIGPRETTGTGKGPRQHLRAAYDVAGAARRHYLTTLTERTRP